MMAKNYIELVKKLENWWLKSRPIYMHFLKKIMLNASLFLMVTNFMLFWEFVMQIILSSEPRLPQLDFSSFYSCFYLVLLVCSGFLMVCLVMLMQKKYVKNFYFFLLWTKQNIMKIYMSCVIPFFTNCWGFDMLYNSVLNFFLWISLVLYKFGEKGFMPFLSADLMKKMSLWLASMFSSWTENNHLSNEMKMMLVCMTIFILYFLVVVFLWI